MKKIALLLLIGCVFTTTYGQVEADKVKNTIAGNNGSLIIPIDVLRLDNFFVNLYLYQYAQDEAGSGAGMAVVGVRTALKELDSVLAQEITDEAYAYFVEQWKKRGPSLVSPAKAELEASKKYSKAAEKGNGRIMGSQVVRTQDKSTDFFTGYPTGVSIAFSGTELLQVNGNGAHIPPDYKGNFFWTAYNGTINYIEFKTAKFGSTASVDANPILSLAGNMAATAWEKTKYGVYSSSQTLKGTSDYYTERKDENFTFLGTSSNTWSYYIDKAKYKANALEMIKKNMDDLFADYDEFIAKEKAK